MDTPSQPSAPIDLPASSGWLRSKGQAIVAGSWGGITAVVCGLIVLSCLIAPEASEDRLTMIVAASAVLATCFFPLRLAVSGVRYDQRSVVVRNVINEWTIDWRDIARFSIGRYAYVPFLGRVHLRDGRTIPIWGIAPPTIAPTNQRTAKLISELNAALLLRLAAIDGGYEPSLAGVVVSAPRRRTFARPIEMWLWLALWATWQGWVLAIQSLTLGEAAFVVVLSVVFAGSFYLRARVIWIAFVVLSVLNILLIGLELLGAVHGKFSTGRTVGELGFNVASFALALTPRMRRLFFANRRPFLPYRHKVALSAPPRFDI